MTFSSGALPPSDSLQIAPLGGLGEIGMNCMVLEQGRHALMIDCGVMFPDGVFGADLIHPDFGYLRTPGLELHALVLTHGHEDHIGGIPFWLRSFDGTAPPIYATPYTAVLVRERLKEHGLEQAVDIRVMRCGESYTMGPWHIQPIAVTHTILDACALRIRTPAGQTVVHSGDFTLDKKPYLGDDYDAASFETIGTQGVDLLLSDSTNSELACRAHNEWDVVMALSEHIKACERRAIVGLFSSNIARVHGLFAAAQSLGRKVCCLGRSVHRHIRCAEELGYLQVDPKIWVDGEEAHQVDPEKLIVIATGSQGEAQAALFRIALGTHPHLNVEPGDQVMLSSRIIPGNEVSVQRMINQFERRGIEVIIPSEHSVLHTTGHASQAEQSQLLRWLKPDAFLPVHGTYRHMSRHAKLAQSLGVPSVCVAENGDKLELQGASLTKIGTVPWGKVFVDKEGVLSPELLRTRGQMARNGVAVVSWMQSDDGDLVGLPVIRTEGMFNPGSDDGWTSQAQAELVQSVASEVDSPTAEVIQRALKRFFKKRFGMRPVSVCVCLEQ